MQFAIHLFFIISAVDLIVNTRLFIISTYLYFMISGADLVCESLYVFQISIFLISRSLVIDNIRCRETDQRIHTLVIDIYILNKSEFI